MQNPKKCKRISNEKTYLHTILQKSQKYLQSEFDAGQYEEFMNVIKPLYKKRDTKEIIAGSERTYYAFVKELYQSSYPYNIKLESFLQDSKHSQKIIWGDCLRALKQMKSESVGCMVTSPPYYNARGYAQYKNLQEYLDFMEEIIKECYRVLDNHRVFVFNVGDVFDNDNLFTKSTWG